MLPELVVFVTVSETNSKPRSCRLRYEDIFTLVSTLRGVCLGILPPKCFVFHLFSYRQLSEVSRTPTQTVMAGVVFTMFDEIVH